MWTKRGRCDAARRHEAAAAFANEYRIRDRSMLHLLASGAGSRLKNADFPVLRLLLSCHLGDHRGRRGGALPLRSVSFADGRDIPEAVVDRCNVVQPASAIDPVRFRWPTGRFFIRQTAESYSIRPSQKAMVCVI
jgi:hypothetical protein